MASTREADFPFLKDSVTRELIGKSKTIFILRSPGNQPLAEAIVEAYPDKAVVCSAQSADQSPQNSQEDETEGKAARFEKSLQKSCESSIPVVIVPDANVELAETKKYRKIAVAFQYTIVLVDEVQQGMREEVLEQKTVSNFSPVFSRSAGEEGVSTDQLVASESLYPLFYGWFVNFQHSKELRELGKSFYNKCLENEKFTEEFEKYLIPDESGKPLGKRRYRKLLFKDPSKYFSSQDCVVGPDMLHSTAFYSNNGQVDQSKTYASREAVRRDIGQAFAMKVIGLFVTRRSLGLRLKLNHEQLPLWFKRPDTRGLSRTPNDRCIITDMSPTCGTGSRAHFSLGSGPGVQPVQTGLDLVELVEAEQKVAREKSGDDYLTITLEGARARCYGNGNWVVYFNEPVEREALYSCFF